jgi:uncharacterized protein
MIKNGLITFLSVFLLTCACQTTGQKINITEAEEDYLRDYVGLLNGEQRQEILSLLTEHNNKFLGRIYLDIMQRVSAGKTIEQYTYDRLNEQPRKSNERADKILVAVALGDRSVRIETSRDVWPILSDDYCHKVNQEIMIPKYKTGEYFGGIKSGIEALIQKLEQT